ACRTGAIAGGPVKCKLCLDEFLYDEAIDYKAGVIAEALRQACLFRQYRGSDQRRRAAAACDGRAGRDLRHGFGCELGSANDRPTRRAASAGQARGCSDSWHSIISTATRKRWRGSPAGCAKAACVIARTSSTASNIAPAPSPSSTAAKTSASGLFACAGKLESESGQGGLNLLKTAAAICRA